MKLMVKAGATEVQSGREEKGLRMKEEVEVGVEAGAGHRGEFGGEGGA